MFSCAWKSEARKSIMTFPLNIKGSIIRVFTYTYMLSGTIASLITTWTLASI